MSNRKPELCPICRKNMMTGGSRRCSECYKKGKNRGARLSRVKLVEDFK